MVFFPTYFGIWANFRYLSLRGPINFLDPSLVYIKFLFPINKQFIIDSFLDWEGHYWVSAPLYQITAPHSLSLPDHSLKLFLSNYWAKFFSASYGGLSI